MVESLLLRLKESAGLEGRITAEFLDEGDCVGEWFVMPWQSCCAFARGDRAQWQWDSAGLCSTGSREVVVAAPEHVWKPVAAASHQHCFLFRRCLAERAAGSCAVWHSRHAARAAPH